MTKNIFQQSPTEVALDEAETAVAVNTGLPKLAPLDLPEIPQYTGPSVGGGKSTANQSVAMPAQFKGMFEAASKKYGVPVNVLMALGEQESRYKSSALGVQTQWGRAQGIMQYLPSTARGLGINPYNPSQSIDAAAKQLKQRLNNGYSMRDAVMEHHGGPNRKLWGRKTRAYGEEVLGRAARLKGELAPEYSQRNKIEPGSPLDKIMSRPLPRSMAEQRAEETRRNAQANRNLGRAPGAPAREDTWGELGSKLYNRAVPLFKKALGGITQGLIEMGASAPVSDDPYINLQYEMGTKKEVTKAIADLRKNGDLPGQALAAAATRDLKENQYNFGDSASKKYPIMIAESMIQMLPTLVATAVTRNPMVGMSATVAQVGGTQYDESRTMGRSVGQAAMDSTFMGFAEGITELVPLGMLMKPGGKFLADTLKVAGAEAAQEMVTEVLQTGYNAGVLKQEMTWGEAVQGVIDAGIVGAGMGVGMKGLHYGTGKAVSTARGAFRSNPADPTAPQDGAQPGPNVPPGPNGPASPAGPAAGPVSPAAPAAPSGPLGRAMQSAPVRTEESRSVPLPMAEGQKGKTVTLQFGGNSQPVELLGSTEDAVWVKTQSGEELRIPHADIGTGAPVQITDSRGRPVQGQPTVKDNLTPAPQAPDLANTPQDIRAGLAGMANGISDGFVDMLHQQASAGSVKDATGTKSPILQVAKKIRARLGGAELSREDIGKIARTVDAVSSTGSQRGADLNAIVDQFAPDWIDPTTGEVVAEGVQAPAAKRPGKSIERPAPEPDGASLVGMSEAELRERLEYLSNQARSGNGWTKAMTKHKGLIDDALAAFSKASEEKIQAERQQLHEELNAIGVGISEADNLLDDDALAEVKANTAPRIAEIQDRLKELDDSLRAGGASVPTAQDVRAVAEGKLPESTKIEGGKTVQDMTDNMLGSITSVAFDSTSNPETGDQRLSLRPDEIASLREHGIEISDDGHITGEEVERLQSERARRIAATKPAEKAPSPKGKEVERNDVAPTTAAPGKVTIEDMPSGKSVLVRGIGKDGEDRIRAALPEKAQPLWNEREQGWQISKKHEDKLRKALIDGQGPAEKPDPQAAGKSIERAETGTKPTQESAPAVSAGKSIEPPAPKPTLAEAEANAAMSPENDHPEPTEAQKEAGNYKKGHVLIGSLDISIENPAGTSRRPEWPPLKHTYGYVKGSDGADGDHVDVFLSPDAEDTRKDVFIVDQVNEDGSFDEHKVMVGFDSQAEAHDAYLSNYEKGWTGLGAITPMPFAEFETWVLDKSATSKPVGSLPSRKPAAAPSEPAAKAPIRDRSFTLVLDPATSTAKTFPHQPAAKASDGPTTIRDAMEMGRAAAAEGKPSTVPPAPDNMRANEFATAYTKGWQQEYGRRVREHREAQAKEEAQAAPAKPSIRRPTDKKNQNPFVRNGEKVTFSEDVEYVKAGEAYTIRNAAKGSAFFENEATGGSTSLQNYQMEAALKNGIMTFVEGGSATSDQVNATPAEVNATPAPEAPTRSSPIEAIYSQSGQQMSPKAFVEDAHNGGRNGQIAAIIDAKGRIWKLHATSNPNGDHAEFFGQLYEADLSDDVINAHIRITGYGTSISVGASEQTTPKQKQTINALRLSAQREAMSFLTETVDGIPDVETDAPSKPNQEPAPSDRFADNTLFTADKVEAARARLRKKMSQLNSGVDPEVLIDGMTIAGAYIEAGVRSFADYARAMRDDFGNKISPYLLSFWEGARNYPGLDTKGMTDVAESARLHQEILAEGLPAEEAPALGTEVAKPKVKAKAAKPSGERTLRTDWGVDNIDGWTEIEGGLNQPTDYGLKGGLKDAFLTDAATYLRAVAAALKPVGFEPHADKKGKASNPVSRQEAGPAVSGDVSLTLQHPVTGAQIYVTIGASSMRGAVPTNQAGVSIMYRVSNNSGDKYATGGVNRWTPTDTNAADLADLIAKEAGGTTPELARTHAEPDTRGSALQSRDRGGVPPVQAGRGSDPQQGAAPATSDVVAVGEPENVGEPASPGPDGQDGVRGAGTHVAEGSGAVTAGLPDDGREGASGAGRADAGTGDAGTGRERPADSDAGAPAAVAGPLSGRTGSAERPVSAEETASNADAKEEVEAPAPAPKAERKPVDPASIEPALPAAPSPDRQGPGNFHLDNPLEIVGGGPVARFDRNRKAIEVFNEIRDEGRAATAEEQRVLAGYIGWGSFGQELFQGTWARSMHKDGWDERGRWLRDHMGQDEWESAQRSITNAHYTDPPTVMAMWAMMQRMGFKGGRILEPSMGIGNFFSMMPAALASRSNLAGIEMDALTGGMAQLLFPDANVKIMPYQQSSTPDGFYDVAIGNWPFENTVIADRRYDRLSPLLHDYFFLKTLDQVRAGGFVIGITSSGSMDKKGAGIRRELAKKAVLVAAFRLPSGAFADYAGTNVVTDIIILKKRAEPISLTDAEGWVQSVPYKTPSGGEVFINEYFLANPSHVIGTIDFGHGTTRGRPGMIVHRPADMAEQLKRVVDLVPEGAYTPEVRTKHISYVANHTADREGALTATKDGLFVVRGEHLAPAEQIAAYAIKDAKKTAQRVDQLKRLVDMRKAYAALIEAERAGDSTAARKALAKSYKEFTKEHGTLSASFGLSYLKKINDPFYASLAALEIDGKPAAIFTKSTTRPSASINNPTIAQAFVLERNQAVNPSLAAIAERVGKPADEVKAELLSSGAVFELPSGDIIPSDMYLSGNVRDKLRQAKAAVAEGMTHLARNVDALAAVVPADVPYFKIETQLGATWISPEIYTQFVAEMLGMPDTTGIEVRYNSGRWSVRVDDRAKNRPEARAGYGTGHYPFQRLVNAAFSNQTVTIRKRDSDGTQYVDTVATEETNGKIAEMRTKFGEWLWSDPERRVEVETEYNEVRNAFATPKFDGSFLTLEGMALSLGNGPFDLRQHQQDAIWRALVSRRSLNAHEVGTGKTFTMGGIAVESRRYGIAKKPLIFAHNANSKSVAAEIQVMYPAAKILYIDNLTPQTIDVKMRQIANDDWDAIVVPHSLIDRFSFKEETLMAMAREEIEALEEEAYAAADDDGVTIDPEMFDDPEALKKLRSPTAKDLVKTRQKVIESIRKQSHRSSREGAVSFEDLGVDLLMVDEAHEFKKPPISTRMKMKGLNTGTSDRSIALSFMTRYVRSQNNGGNIHLFTGTPVTNTLTEVFHMMRYIMQEEMQVAGVDQWDGWFGSFAREVMDVEQNAAAEYEAVTRLAGFINVPELRRMIGQYMDVVFANDMPEMQPRRTTTGKTMADELTERERAELLNGRTEGAKDRPYKKIINVTSDLTPQQKVIFEELRGYARAWRAFSGKQRKEAMAAGSPESPIITEGLATKASFDVRLYDGERLAGMEGKVKDDEGSKISRVIENVKEIYESHDLATQVIFAEMGFSNRVTRSLGRDEDGNKKTKTLPWFSTIRDLQARLVQSGIPAEQIAIVDGSTSKDRRKEIAAAMNTGKIRVVIGSTLTLGVGVNMQRNLRAMHHLDAPWMPGDLEQRNGRGQRQGNQWNTVLEYRYLTDRLDGRRWQVLAIKQRFITAFLKADDSARVIEGEAAADEQSDILQSFAEAAGDPRILIREKLRKQLEGAQRRERLHTQGIADALRQARSIEGVVGKTQAELAEIQQRGTVETIGKLIADNAGKSFSIKFEGKTYTTRKEADEAMLAWSAFNMRVGDEHKPVGKFGGHDLMMGWPARDERPQIRVVIDGKAFNGVTVQGLENSLRSFAAEVERKSTGIAGMVASAKRLKATANEPFHMAADLARFEKALDDLEIDIAENPVPPPAWLRAGAPVDTSVFWHGAEMTVTGHRWTPDGWFVVAEDARGPVVIPYMDAKDAQGIPAYEEREFEKPEVVTKDDKKAEGQAADSDGTAHSLGTIKAGGFTSANGLREHLAQTRLGKAIGNLIARGKIVLHDTAATLPGAPARTIGSYSMRQDPGARAFLLGEPVASMKGDEVPAGTTGVLKKWAADHFARSVGSAVTHSELGSIKLDQRAAKDSLGHGFGELKKQGLFLLPEALSKARILAEESRIDGQVGWVLAAPVAINGDHHIMTMVVKRTDNRTGLYVHEVRVTEEVVRDAAISTAVPAEAGQSRGSSRTVAIVLQAVLAVNADGNRQSSDFNSIQAMTAPDGTIHLVADRLTSRTALPVLLHEMFHAGVRPLIGDAAWNQTLKRIGALYRAAAGREGTGERTNSPFWQRALRSVEYAQPPAGQEVEEFAAYAIEHYAQAPAGLRAYLDRLVGAFKAWTLRRFNRQLGAVTPAQLEALAKAALRTGRTGPTSGAVVKTSIQDTGPVSEEAADAILTIAENDDLFAIERTDATTVEQAMLDIVPGVRHITSIEDVSEARDGPFEDMWEEHNPDRMAVFETANGKRFYAIEKNDRVWIDVSRFTQGDNGSHVYMATAEYALNAGKVFIGDPAGLSDDALIRRTDLMLSIALKHRTTDHIAPHPRQLAGDASLGVPALAWEMGDFYGNVRSLIGVTLDTLAPHVPLLRSARYDVGSRAFVTRSGQPLTDDAVARAAGNARSAGRSSTGSRTVKRAIVLKTLSRNEGGETSRLLERALFAGAQSVYSPTLEDTFYSKAAPTSEDVDIATPALIQSALTNAMVGGGKGQFNTLSLVPLRPLLAEMGRGLPAARDYLKLKQAMDAHRDQWHAKADDVAQPWLKFRVLKKGANERLMDLMHEATLEGVDPALPFASSLTPLDEKILAKGPKAAGFEEVAEKVADDQVRKKAYDRLRTKFEALPAEAQRLFNEVRNTYTELGDEFERVLIENLSKAQDISLKAAYREHDTELHRIKNSADMSKETKEKRMAEAAAKLDDAKRVHGWTKGARMTRLRALFETHKLQGPYFPLARFGEFFVTARSKESDEVVSFSRFEDSKKQAAFAADMRKEGYDVEVGVLSNQKDVRGAVDARFVADIESILEDADAPDIVRDAVWQRWLETMPDMSVRTNRIHRKGREGYSVDALRAFGNHLFHGSHQLARLKYALDLNEALANAREQAKLLPDPVRGGALVNEIQHRHEFIMNPTGSGWVQNVTSAAFIYYLSTSPAAAMVNVAQTAILGVPILAAYHGDAAAGMAKASAALTRAMKDFTVGKGHIGKAGSLTAQERDAIEEAYATGLIERTQSHDLAGVGETGVEYRPGRAKVMAAISWAFHHTERMNREVTFLAAYRMARAKGELHNTAIETAADLTWKIHFDYQNTSRPRVMQGDTAKVLLVFRNFSVNMLWRLFRDAHQAVKGGTKRERKEALTQLGGTTAMMMLSAGIRGTWFYGLAMGIAALLFGDDAEDDFRTGIIESLGTQLGGMALNGIPGHLFGVNISERIGMPDLWFRSPERELEGKAEFEYWVMQSLGAAVGIGSNIWTGIGKIRDGHTQRGIETMAPKFAKDLMRAYRYMSEGATTLDGDPLIENMSTTSALKQALGFMPAELAERYDQNSALKNREQKILGERKSIMADYDKAARAGEDTTEIEVRLEEYNTENPDYPITPKSLRTSMRSRQKMRDNKVGGLNLNAKLADRLREEATPLIYANNGEELEDAE